MTFRRILVATDFAPSAEAAWQAGIDLARAQGAELVLLHVYVELPAYAGAGASHLERVYEEQRQWVEKALETRVDAAVARGVTARSLLRTGRPAETIADTVLDEMADLVIVGMHGGDALDRLVVGSVTERVVRLAPCPVLVMKPLAVGAATAAAA